MIGTIWNKIKSVIDGSLSKYSDCDDSLSDTLSESDEISVIAKFKFLPGKKTEFIDILKGPDGLEVTRKFEGCNSIECHHDIDDENTLILLQKWSCRSCHEAYLKMREETGLLDVLKPQLAEPLVPIYLNYDETI
tara:strand:- start:20191 stop:20595 length:405 start_codon:yes stop_codon:yes gene_type:complete